MENQTIKCSKWLELLELRINVVGNAKPALNFTDIIADTAMTSSLTITTSMTITRPR